ncbi:MAG TPA: NAD(P)/FAD-dependent oxidoreductase [Aestuariivirga sp.]|nr:NAD(P)/FAD-dependent oxidoreductase [Aestuariivirga sp.]
MTISADTATVKRWLAKLGRAAERNDAKTIASMFGRECYWRDLIALTWNIRTVEGRDGIEQMLSYTLPHSGLSKIKMDGDAKRNGKTIEAWFTFETSVARGRGHLRLKNGSGYTVLTTMQELKGHEEKRGITREEGIFHGAHPDRKVWHEERARENLELGNSRQPYCVIVGGGQGGIALGARLKRLGVETIIVDRNARAGDSWRNRYRSLVLHDPVWYDHLPYIPFPSHWPVFCPKDKLGDWLEMYTKVMELNYWGATECRKAAFDPASNTWAIQVERDGKRVELRPKQLIFATGSYGPPREPHIKGKERFQGLQYHSGKHTTARPHKGKRCIVLGANSSAHDICADFWEMGAEVTMIQRTPTTVVRSETLMDVAFKDLYSEEAFAKGINVDKADLIFASVPFRLQPDLQRKLYQTMAKRDARLLKRLNAAGFMTDFGEDGSGLLMKALRTGSGYYIDVGCSELIARGDVKVRSRVEIDEIKEKSVLLTDGSELPADIIVYATGYLPMNEWLATVISREVADRIGPNWGYGSGTRGDPGPWQGELRNMWKPLKQEALWFHGGNLHLSRHYSQFLALQIKARSLGLATPVY